MQELKIPQERIAMLLGKVGSTKRELETKTGTKIRVDSDEGDVLIEGDELKCFITLNIIKAIGRGFNPKIALRLLNEENILEIINMEDYLGNNKKKILTARSRLIGTGGKARRSIESLTFSNISVYGKTVAIIGEIEKAEIAKQALINLIMGSKHGNVYAFIDKRKKSLDEEEIKAKE